MVHNYYNRYFKVTITVLLALGVILLVFTFIYVRQCPDRQSQSISFFSYDIPKNNTSGPNLFNPLELATRLANKTALQHQIHTIGKYSYGNMQSSVLHISYEASREVIWKFWEDFNKSFNKEIKLRKYSVKEAAGGGGYRSNRYRVKTEFQDFYIYALWTEEYSKNEFVLVSVSVPLDKQTNNRSGDSSRVNNLVLLEMEESDCYEIVNQSKKGINLKYLGAYGTDSTYSGSFEFLRFVHYSIPKESFALFADNFRKQTKKLIRSKKGTILNEGRNSFNKQPQSFFYTYKREGKIGIFSSSFMKTNKNNEYVIAIIILELPES